MMDHKNVFYCFLEVYSSPWAGSYFSENILAFKKLEVNMK